MTTGDRTPLEAARQRAISSDEEGRVCTRCGQYKFLDSFYQNYSNRSWCKECTRIQCIKYRAELKQQTIAAYGGSCNCCGEMEVKFLTVDHVNGGGGELRRRDSKSPHLANRIHRWLRDNEFPEDFQILCFNCNSGRQINGGVCPHHIQVVKVKIFTPEIECPDHHPWFPENPRYPWDEDGDIYTILRETYERWRQIQLDWELMNEEMHQLTGRV